jgi:hypothetical protein
MLKRTGLLITASILALALTLTACGGGTAANNAASAEKSTSSTTETAASQSTQSETSATDNKSETANKESSDSPYATTIAQFHRYTNSSGKNCYSGIVEVTNTSNDNLRLKSGNFNLEDENGSLLATNSATNVCPRIIAPGESGYYAYHGYLPEGITPDTPQNVNLVPELEIEETEQEPLDYEVTDTKMTKDGLFTKVIGRCKNTSTKEDHSLFISVEFFDANGQILGITGTNKLMGIKPDEQKTFEVSTVMLPTYISKDQIAGFKVIARQSPS